MAKGKVGLGRQGEALAAAELVCHGFSLVACNWHCREGEVDLIARRNWEWYFFEVRTRRGTMSGTPEESATPRKRARMEAVACRYLGEETDDLDPLWHLGFVAVEMDAQGHLLRVTVYPDLEGEPL